PGSPETPCDFLSEVEAARLIWLIIDEGVSSGSIFVNAGTGKPSTLGEIESLIVTHFPDMAIKYSGDNSDVPPPMRIKTARSDYGWNVLHSLTDDFPQIKSTIAPARTQRFAKLANIGRLLVRFFRGSKGFIVLEFIAATAILHLLTEGLRSFTFSTWLDLRLIFVVLLSTLHGTFSGIASGIIAGIMLFVSLGNTDWRVIVYNPENWIPFALYLIMGVALGSRADRQRDNQKSNEDRLTLAEQTNVYLVDLYDEAVNIKDKYRDQILGYKDNFGRIYTIVKKLNAETSDHVFSSAIEVLEDVMENDTVAVYSITSNGSFGRLTVCSKAFYSEITRSIRLSDYPQIMDKVEQKDIWFNRDLIHGFPSYCSPVYNEDKLIALVMIWKAGVNQMTLHYSNLFKILSGLIQESLVRAVKFNELQESTLYFPDTRIMMREPFRKTYRTNMALAEQEKAFFGLLAVQKTKEDITEQDNRMESCIRESDIIGEINAELFCIILKNVSDDDIAVLADRFEAKGLVTRRITPSQMHELMAGETG
ncbi:MAG: hypothetical protein FWG46_00750, partial [Treponema sp.]|nr:hypothetical protein [Treponema sp.]